MINVKILAESCGFLKNRSSIPNNRPFMTEGRLEPIDIRELTKQDGRGHQRIHHGSE